MNLEQKINEKLKEAMKSKEKQKLDALRSLRAAVIDFAKSGLDREMNEDDELKILNSAAKKRREAIEMYSKAGRDELREQEEFELKVIEEFLPKQLEDSEIEAKVKEIIESIGASGMQDMGKVMGQSIQSMKGKADGNRVQAVVKQLLGNS